MIPYPLYGAFLHCRIDVENIIAEIDGDLTYVYYCNIRKKDGKLHFYKKVYICNDGKNGYYKDFYNYHNWIKEKKDYLFFSVNFKNDFEIGEAKQYNADGSIKILYNYKNGLLDGEAILFEKDKVKEKILFKENEIVLLEKHNNQKMLKKSYFDILDL